MTNYPELTFDHDVGEWSFGGVVLRVCERCDMIGDSENVKFVPSQTMYHWEGEGKDPNADKLFCDECAEAYDEMMKSWWADAVHNI